MRLLAMLILALVTPADRCADVQLEGLAEVGCRLKEESHGWKLWFKLRYNGVREYEQLEKPVGREFWPSDRAAFERCSEWRACVTQKVLRHREEQRRNRQ